MPPPRSTEPVVLAVDGVSVHFGGLAALSDVSLEVRAGEIVGLIGPNGAGKTTLMECISGFQAVNAGGVRFRRAGAAELSDLLAASATARADLGIGRTLQNVRLFPYLTVLDNLRIALHRHQRRGAVMDALRLPAARNEERETLAEAKRLIDLFGMETFTEHYASELSYGTLRLLELACMLALDAKLLLLDEPASGISQKETEALGPLLRRIKAQTGATILMIEHDMSLVMGLADWIYCLDAGQNLSNGPPEIVKADPAVIEAYLGTPRERQMVEAQARKDVREAKGAEVGPTLLELRGVDAHYGKLQVLNEVNVTVRQGERIALLGTNGAGKSTILKVASGILPASAGQVTWKGEAVKSTPAEQLVRKGLAQVPGGRGLFPSLSVGENLRMGGYIYDDQARVLAEMDRVIPYFPWIKERFAQTAGTLSGGEQQQLATARALMSRPELLMIDELSLGLAPIVIERLMETVQRLHEEEAVTIVIVEQQASFALGYTDRAYFLEKGTVRYDGPSAGLSERPDLLRSVFLAGAVAGFREEQGAARPVRRRREPLRAAGRKR